ncbi:MAG: glycosyltransferase family 1 protein [Chitinophagaceae bacterium]|nr:glycosyltransferase family 1 protein [Chitinophagaceae bacterium]
MSYDIICFSHLRWNFVYQRPQHLLKRFAIARHRVFYVEEAICDSDNDFYEIKCDEQSGVQVVLMHISTAHDPSNGNEARRALVNALVKDMMIEEFMLWYYAPMAIEYTDHLEPRVIVYDCMDELSGFRFAPTKLKENERVLMNKADLVFTGGYSLYEAKKEFHSNIFAFPSSIDKEHFIKARQPIEDPEDQKNIPQPRLGFYGVIDERFDIDMVREMADKRPDFNFVLVGPIVKIDPATLPERHNIFYLGSKTYNELPLYLSGWDIAIMPFALNESTKFISPTKTPEFLSGGKPVISTPIQDVVHPYGSKGLVNIASSAEEFIKYADEILEKGQDRSWLSEVDKFLSDISWDITWGKMASLIDKIMDGNNIDKHTKQQQHV